MRIKTIAGIGLATLLVATPIAAQQASAEVSRQSAPATDANGLVGESTLVFVLGIAAVAAAIVLLSEDDDPVSP